MSDGKAGARLWGTLNFASGSVLDAPDFGAIRFEAKPVTTDGEAVSSVGGSEDMDERRGHERYETSISVDYWSGETFLFSYITNISEMGIFIASNDPLPVGTMLQLRFTSPLGTLLELEGEVVWVNPIRLDGDNVNPGMGVRFTTLTAAQRELVVDIVKTVAYLRDDTDSN